MPGKPRILFWGSDKHWFGVLEKALGSYADFFQENPKNLSSLWRHREYKIIIVDTLDVSKMKLFAQVTDLKNRQPNANIVVISASPTWTAVREALKAGAADYIVKSFDPVKIENDLKPYLS
jgi:two-component system chemotaxis response regulator CheY